MHACYIIYTCMSVVIFNIYTLLDIECVYIMLCSDQANIGGDDLYSFDERRIYNDQDLSDLVSIACEVLGKSVSIFSG